METKHKRSSFSGRLGYVMAVAGSAVGLGNIWRFPYLAAKYGGGTFLFTYFILAITFGFALLISETALGRKTKKSPIAAYKQLGAKKLQFGGWLNAIVPMLIVPYYCVVGGWVCKYLFEFITNNSASLVSDTYFTGFSSSTLQPVIWLLVFAGMVFGVVMLGVEKGIEKCSKVLMPALVAMALFIALYALFTPGAIEGVKYYLIPDFSRFSIMTVVAAMGQMFYSLSIAMGILITFGSYMKKDVSIEGSTENVEIFDTAIAIMAGLMIIPAVFSFSGGNMETLKAGPSLMFITIPKVFASMGLGTGIGIIFFLLVLFAAITSSIALTESAVSTFQDELHWSRKKSTIILGIIMIGLGTLSCLGYGPLSNVTIIGMQFLDFFDFLTNSVMMPIAAIAICIFVSRVVGLEKVEAEITKDGNSFKRKKIFNFMIQYLCPIFAFIILLSSIANAFGFISM